MAASLTAALTATVALLLPHALSARPMTAKRAAAIDAAVQSEMARIDAKGLALAVVENGKVVLVRAYGLRNVDGRPLQIDTAQRHDGDDEEGGDAAHHADQDTDEQVIRHVSASRQGARRS